MNAYILMITYKMHTYLQYVISLSVISHFDHTYRIFNNYFDKTAPIQNQRNDVIQSKQLIHKRVRLTSFQTYKNDKLGTDVLKHNTIHSET
jgi:hypothetical protein